MRGGYTISEECMEGELNVYVVENTNVLTVRIRMTDVG